MATLAIVCISILIECLLVVRSIKQPHTFKWLVLINFILSVYFCNTEYHQVASAYVGLTIVFAYLFLHHTKTFLDTPIEFTPECIAHNNSQYNPQNNRIIYER